MLKMLKTIETNQDVKLKFYYKYLPKLTDCYFSGKYSCHYIATNGHDYDC